MSIHTPILIVGGGTGGTAAALAIVRRGGHCIITEPTDWIGGQLTSQAVPPDENRWIDDLAVPAAPASYLNFRRAVRQWYRDHRPLTPNARADANLNPGNGWVSRLCCEPRVAHAVLVAMLAPHVAAGRITVLLHHTPVAADVTGDRVRSITLADTRTGTRQTISADYVLDATETGALLPLTGTEYAVGAEHCDVHGELHGRSDHTDPRDQQALSWCFAMEHCPGANHTIARPERYDFWRSYIPPLTPPWSGPLFAWSIIVGETHVPRVLPLVPWPEETPDMELWRYRRIVDTSLYQPDAAHDYPDVSLVNWVQMDYFLRPILDVPAEEVATALAEARELSYTLLYWMQTEAPHADGRGAGFPGLKLRGAELGTSDGLAKAPYIREARRLLARTIVNEGHVGLEQRAQAGHLSPTAPPWGLAEPFADSVGIGHYWLDLHPSTAGRNNIFIHAAPFRIPMGALIPRRMRNLLAAGKCLGVTHITNGCYRLHPVEWNVGEAAGILAHFCLDHGHEPHQVHASLPLIRAVQQVLHDTGVPLAWPWEAHAGL